MSRVVELTKQLVAMPSLTPEDAGCQQLISERLARFGFDTEWLSHREVTNVLITRGDTQPSVWFLGHTDVVPTGGADNWDSPPFIASERQARLYGRGVADMKGAVAAMVVALESFAQQQADHAGQIGLLLTSDEEGPSIDGVRYVAEVLRKRGVCPDYCIVGEPSSQMELADTVRIGRRGSINASLTIHGVQGHTAYAQGNENPVHQLAPFLAALTRQVWDQGDSEFPATSLQVSNLQAGTGASNVTPGEVTVQFNIRNGSHSTAEQIKQQIESLLAGHSIKRYSLAWKVSGEPFVTRVGRLREVVKASIQELLGVTPVLDTGGGTSDGRFIAPLGAQVVELGLINQSIHQINENTVTAHLDQLYALYYDILRRLLTGAAGET